MGSGAEKCLASFEGWDPTHGTELTCQGSQELLPQALPAFICCEVLLWALLSPDTLRGFESRLLACHLVFSTVQASPLDQCSTQLPKTWAPLSLSRSWALPFLLPSSFCLESGPQNHPGSSKCHFYQRAYPATLCQLWSPPFWILNHLRFILYYLWLYVWLFMYLSLEWEPLKGNFILILGFSAESRTVPCPW